MAVTLISNYSKRLGLPNFSSHQFSVSVETELTDLERVPGEISRLYELLQSSIDREILQVGFVPDESYGLVPPSPSSPLRVVDGNGAATTTTTPETPAQGSTPAGNWNCSLKQRQLITDLAAELDLSDEQLAERVKLFSGLPIEKITKLSASNLISSLLEEANQRRKASRKNAA